MRILKRVLALALCIAAVSTAGCQKAAKTDNNDSTEESRKTVSTADDTVADGTVKYPEFVNPLTGLGTETDVSNKRPVSIMVNNINISLPQEGICGADIMYECLAEGGITRLMMIATEYEKLPQFFEMLSELSEATDVNFYFTISCDKEDLPVEIFDYCEEM